MSKTPKFKKDLYASFTLPTDDMDTNIVCHKVKLVKVRKESKCTYCGSTIAAGDYAQSESGFLDNWNREPFYVHNCLDCIEDYIDLDRIIDSDEYYRRWEQRAKASGYIE